LQPPRRSTLFPYTTLFRSDGDALAAMRAVRRVFDPDERVNPGKVVPVHACREWSGWVPRAIGPGSAARDQLSSADPGAAPRGSRDRKSTRLNSSHVSISYA